MNQNKILKKNIAIEFAGSAELYQIYKRSMGGSSSLYSNDFHFYNDDATLRHERNIKELRLLKKYIKEGKIQPKECIFNTYNTFYPSYVVHHHYDSFIKSLNLFGKIKEVEQVAKLSKSLEVVGAVFDLALSWNMKNAKDFYPTVNQKGQISMDQSIFFYSKVTSLYANYCVFLAKSGNSFRICLIKLRESDGSLAKGINIRDFGSTISSDYLIVGYNFNKVKTNILSEGNILNNKVKDKPLRIYKSFQLKNQFDEFYLSLKDLHKSLHLTIKYTSMRRQFKTLDNSKEERRILTYQGVAARIIDGFSTYVAFSDLNSKINGITNGYILYAELMQSAHHVILERLIHLRECCGGFGYLQASGHPGCIERVAFRAGFKEETTIPLTPQFLQKIHYYTSSDSLLEHYTKALNKNTPTNQADLFGIFCMICIYMRSNRKVFTNQVYNREMARQSAIQEMRFNEQMSRHGKDNIHDLLLQYTVSGYILEHGKFMDWEKVGIEREGYFNELTNFRNKILNKIIVDIEPLGQTLQVDFVRNAIVGREDSVQFYKQVLQVSRNSQRNSKQFNQYVKKPLVEMLTENNARL